MRQHATQRATQHATQHTPYDRYDDDQLGELDEDESTRAGHADANAFVDEITDEFLRTVRVSVLLQHCCNNQRTACNGQCCNG